MVDKIVIRPVGKNERAAWEPLWNGYLAFYKATLAPDANDIIWQRFHDPEEQMFLLGAYVDGRLAGIVQYLFHRSTWTPESYCYLQDLFVAEDARGLVATHTGPGRTGPPAAFRLFGHRRAHTHRAAVGPSWH